MAEKPRDIDAYIAALPEELRGVAEAVRAAIKAAAPDAVEAISYSIPAFKMGKKTIVFFAVWKKHVGLYPICRGDADFEAAVGPYRAKSDTVQLPHNQPLPNELIARIVAHQLAH